MVTRGKLLTSGCCADDFQEFLEEISKEFRCDIRLSKKETDNSK